VQSGKIRFQIGKSKVPRRAEYLKETKGQKAANKSSLKRPNCREVQKLIKGLPQLRKKKENGITPWGKKGKVGLKGVCLGKFPQEGGEDSRGENKTHEKTKRSRKISEGEGSENSN